MSAGKIAARDRLIVALDFPRADTALDLVDRLGDAVLWYKVGLQLYLAVGRSILDELRRREKQVFLDLKLHDIPNTVAGAVQNFMSSGVSLLTVHASGGPAMLRAAVGSADMPGAPKLLGVTVLTSMDEVELHSVGVLGGVQEQVLRLAELATSAGLPGLVCSSQEVSILRQRFAPELLLVVPGIRSVAAVQDDQHRVASASEAIRMGASMLVVGRPITAAKDPVAAANALLDEIDQGLRRAEHAQKPDA